MAGLFLRVFGASFTFQGAQAAEEEVRIVSPSSDSPPVIPRVVTTAHEGGGSRRCSAYCSPGPEALPNDESLMVLLDSMSDPSDPQSQALVRRLTSDSTGSDLSAWALQPLASRNGRKRRDPATSYRRQRTFPDGRFQKRQRVGRESYVRRARRPAQTQGIEMPAVSGHSDCPGL